MERKEKETKTKAFSIVKIRSHSNIELWNKLIYIWVVLTASFDQLLGYYTTCVVNRAWQTRIFTHFMSAMSVNANILYQLDKVSDVGSKASRYSLNMLLEALCPQWNTSCFITDKKLVSLQEIRRARLQTGDHVSKLLHREIGQPEMRQRCVMCKECIGDMCKQCDVHVHFCDDSCEHSCR